MKRIWIAGSAGSGKTTLANRMGELLKIPVFHRDYITWDRDFDTALSEEEQIALTKDISRTDKWIFDGARFTAARIDGRLDRCDTIIHLNFNRFICLYRAIKKGQKKKKRSDLREIDKQPFHFSLFQYILLEYPRKKDSVPTCLIWQKVKESMLLF